MRKGATAVETTHDEAGVLRFVIRLLIKHPSIDPGSVTAELGLQPRVTHLVGAGRMTPAGAPLSGVYKESMWGWSERIERKRAFFEAVAELVHKLESHAPFISDLIHGGGSVEMIVHLPGDINIGSVLPWTEMKKLAELRVDLGIEVFPRFD